MYLAGFAYIASHPEYPGQPEPPLETLVALVSFLWGLPGVAFILLGHFGWRRVPGP